MRLLVQLAKVHKLTFSFKIENDFKFQEIIHKIIVEGIIPKLGILIVALCIHFKFHEIMRVQDKFRNIEKSWFEFRLNIMLKRENAS